MEEMERIYFHLIAVNIRRHKAANHSQIKIKPTQPSNCDLIKWSGELVQPELLNDKSA